MISCIFFALGCFFLWLLSVDGCDLCGAYVREPLDCDLGSRVTLDDFSVLCGFVAVNVIFIWTKRHIPLELGFDSFHNNNNN